MARVLLPPALGRLPVLDATLAAALCVLAVGGLVTGAVDERPLAVTLPIGVVSTLAMALRTRFPLAVAGVVAVLAVAQPVFADEASNTLWSLVVFLVAAYTVAAECDEAKALVGLGLVIGAQFACEWLDHGSDYPFDTLVFGGVWLFGRATRSWRDQALHAEQHQRDLARLAVADERARIARELHDVVAHSLSVIAVQADAAEAALDRDPGRAAAPMRAIRDSARHALVDMRQLLHVLRADDDPDTLVPARRIGDLTRLVADLRASGMPLEADLDAPSDLPSGLELAVFRIAQEGLTNVRKHAGDVPTRLVVACEDGELSVQVRNDPPMPDGAALGRALSTGHGLIGVRERVLAAGGVFAAEPTESGGFQLLARLPLNGARR
jgi:signal transduction histidine kinase